MVSPDYKGSGIVNLMSSIQHAYGVKSRYNELAMLPSSEIRKKKNVVLMVLDGFGYDYLKAHKSVLNDNLRGRMTSVFPPTTAAAITTFVTGVAPQQHAFTSWYMKLKELGMITAILPYASRAGKIPLKDSGIPYSDIAGVSSFFRKNRIKAIHITKDNLASTDCTNICGPCKIIGSGTLRSFFMNVNKAVKMRGKKYVYAYWPMFDSLCHHNGVASKEVKEHFNEICSGIVSLTKRLEGTDTMLIITADHGLTDISQKNIIDIAKHPVIQNCMTLPLCGEPRAGYFYIHPSKAKIFERYVKENLSEYGTLYKGEELIKRNYYGLFEANKKLSDRIGDYVLIMKEGYIIRDYLSDAERNRKHKAHHGGISSEEMYVPLIVYDL